MQQLSEDIRKKVILFQQTEITEYHIYKRLAKRSNRLKMQRSSSRSQRMNCVITMAGRNIQNRKCSRAGSSSGSIISSALLLALHLASN